MTAATLEPTKTMFKEVLVATDFSQLSDHALAYAESIVRSSNGELLLAHVAESIPHIAIPEGEWVDDEFGNTIHMHASEIPGDGEPRLDGSEVDLLIIQGQHRVFAWPSLHIVRGMQRILAETPCPILVLPPSAIEPRKEGSNEPS